MITCQERDITPILKKFNIEAEHVEPFVYKVINTSEEIDIDKLKWELNNCFLISSPTIRYIKNPKTGINTEIANLYYIITDISENKKAWELQDLADKIYGNTIIDSYNSKSNTNGFIDTIYSKQEIQNV